MSVCLETRLLPLGLLVLACLVACGGATGGMGHEHDRAWEPERPGVVLASDESVEGWQVVPGEDNVLAVLTDPGELPRLHVAGDQERLLPLEHTHVKARLLGFVASVEVSQSYQNPFDRPIEVTYVFPLPENSAVGAMEMHVGSRVVRAKIEERREARRIYEAAKRRGHTAALLEQERPNVFTQSVANIAPGEKIDVVIRYVQDLSYDAGRYEFVFPMVVGPRYIPGTTLDQALRGDGTHLDTDRVPDASRITPPVLGKGERSGHDISIEVLAETTLPIAEVTVPTHEVVMRKPADGTLRLALAEKGSIPNRDFVMRYRVAGKEPLATLVTSGEREGGYFALVVHPPDLDVESLVGRREITFVVDISGSMAGQPLGMCKIAMREALSRLRPYDTFNILTFAGATRKLFPRARPANRDNIADGLAFLARAQAGGGTEMGNAVTEALNPPIEAGRHRYVFFLTDGYVGDEEAIIAGSKDLVDAAARHGQKARVFGFGVGSSVNRHLLDGLSRAGNGLAVYATTREDPTTAVDRFFRYIDRAVLTDLRVSWGELGSFEIYPSPAPDLFASHPVILHGRYKSLSERPVVISARRGEERIELPVRVQETLATGDRGGIIGALWARSKVEHLQASAWVGMRPDAPAAITKLGLEYDLVTPYTSFVAVDESRRVGDGNPDRIVQPVEVPEGVDGVAAGARTGRPRTSLSQPPQVGPSGPPPPSRDKQDDDYGQELDEEAATLGMTPIQPSDPRPEIDDEHESYYGDAPGAAPPEVGRDARGCYCATTAPTSDRRELWLSLLAFALVSRRFTRRRRR
jgi:Ca-activated chloride channel homolog